MADRDIQNSECFLNIQISQKLLGSLKEDMTDMKNLMSRAFITASNLEGTWTALRVTHENYERWKRDLENS